jgi:hypothetical protein
MALLALVFERPAASATWAMRSAWFIVDLLSLDEVLRYNVAIERAIAAAKPISFGTGGSLVSSLRQANHPCLFPSIWFQRIAKHGCTLEEI